MPEALPPHFIGHDKTCADAILPKGHERQEKTGYKFDAGFVLQ
jgi:hypothetical protein